MRAPNLVIMTMMIVVMVKAVLVLVLVEMLMMLIKIGRRQPQGVAAKAHVCNTFGRGKLTGGKLLMLNLYKILSWQIVGSLCDTLNQDQNVTDLDLLSSPSSPQEDLGPW